MKRGGFLNRRTPLKRGRWKKSKSGLWTAIEKECPEIGKGILEAARKDEVRAEKDFARKFGSVDRVLFFKHGLRCFVANCYRNPCENAHGDDGKEGSYKGGHLSVNPLCRWHHTLGRDSYHACGSQAEFERRNHFVNDMTWDEGAAFHERQWQATGAEWVRTWRELRAAEQAVDLA